MKCFSVGITHLLCLGFVTSDPGPGLSLSVSLNGLHYAAQVAVDQLSDEVRGKTIPDQHGKADVDIGKVDYSVTEMRIQSFTKPGFTVTVSPGQGLQASLTNAGVSVNGNWRYSYNYLFVHISDHGSFDVSVSGATLHSGITMGKSSDGHPTISMTSCSCTIGSVHVKFHGGASWLYNLFSGNVEDLLRKNIEDILCTSVKKSIDTDANKALARMKVKVNIHKTPLFIDYRLVTAPVFGQGFIQTNHKGEFFWASDTTEAPFQPKKITKPTSTHKMATICLSDYVMDTLGYVMNKYRFLKYTLTAKELKDSDRAFLNTTCLGGPKCIGSLIPPLGEKFPNSTVEISMQTTSGPTLHTVSGHVTARFKGTVVFNVRKADRSLVLGFSTDTVANVSLTGQVSLNDSNRVTAQVKHIGFKMTVVKSNVGKISDVFLNTVFGFAIKVFVIPQMNKVGSAGFPLPSVDVVQFVNPEIDMLQDTLCFGTDLKYVG